MFGSPPMAGEAHVPAAADVDEDPDEAAADPPDAGPVALEPALLAAFTAEGEVGMSALDLLENWQPVRSTDAASVTVKAQIFFITSRYTSVCARTVLVRAVNENPGKSGKTWVTT